MASWFRCSSGIPDYYGIVIDLYDTSVEATARDCSNDFLPQRRWWMGEVCLERELFRYFVVKNDTEIGIEQRRRLVPCVTELNAAS